MVAVPPEDIHRASLIALRRLLAEEKADPAKLMGEAFQQVLAYRLRLVGRAIVRACGFSVQGGPFFGMAYLDVPLGRQLVPKLLGSYELELHPILYSAPARRYRSVVNIGCGEGYYAVGLARMLSGVTVHAFDSDARARQLCRRLAEINKVADRIVIGATCTAALLGAVLANMTLLICDCEGCEVELLDPAKVPGLAHCDILVELHDLDDPRISEAVIQRFRATHDVQFIDHAGRDPGRYSILRGLGQIDQFLALWEGRAGPTPWAFMRRRGRR